MKTRAFAKINLTLEVLGIRPDGYHDLRSVVEPVSLADVIEIEPRRDGRITVETVSGGAVALDALDARPEKNLAWRAADSLRRHAGKPDAGADIFITKNIPLGGGLGGGSADAAAVLNALSVLWGLDLPVQTLAEIGAETGSDVPSLVFGRTVLMEGRGERVSSWPAETPDLPIWHFVLANPGIHSSTPAVFKEADCTSRLTSAGEITDNMRLAFSSGDPRLLAAAMQNDLTVPAQRLYPRIAEAAAALLEAGAMNAVLTGSGSTVAGVVRDAAEGEAVCRKIPGGFRAVCVSSARWCNGQHSGF